MLTLAYKLDGPPPGAPVELDEPVGVGVEELVSNVGELFWIGSKLLLVKPPETKLGKLDNFEETTAVKP